MPANKLLCAVVAFTGLAAAAHAQSGTIAQVVIDGQVYTLPTALTEGSDRVYLTPTVINGSGFTLEVLNGIIDPDPSISWGIAVTDFGAPSSFAFMFSTPIVPTGSPNVVFGSIVGGVTDNTGDGASITPTAGLNIMINEVGTGAPIANMGVDVGPAQVYAAGPAGALHNYGSFSTPTIAGPLGIWTSLHSTVSFNLSGNGDIAVLTGYASIEEVPAPGAATLLALGGALVARRRRSA